MGRDKEGVGELNIAYNLDCLEAMKQMEDNAFDLAVVDPPYGDGLADNGGGRTMEQIRSEVRPIQTVNRSGFHGKNPYHLGGERKTHLTSGRRKGQGQPDWWNVGGEIRKKIIAWDVAPKQEYFEELFRVSRNQIIWGGQLLRLAADEVLSCVA